MLYLSNFFLTLALKREQIGVSVFLGLFRNVSILPRKDRVWAEEINSVRNSGQNCERDALPTELIPQVTDYKRVSCYKKWKHIIFPTIFPQSNWPWWKYWLSGFTRAITTENYPWRVPKDKCTGQGKDHQLRSRLSSREMDGSEVFQFSVQDPCNQQATGGCKGSGWVWYLRYYMTT